MLRSAMVLAAMAVAACATPQERFRAELATAGLRATIVVGGTYDHLVVKKPGGRTGHLNVYIEGDGVPWRGPGWPAEDPTPAAPLAFRLMQRDPGEAIYLGRPCYFGVGARHCDPRVWTDERYSEAVVASMAEALAATLGRRINDPLRLIGHSGGGVLATLVAPRLPQVAMVITVGANLDVAAWASLHGYTALAGSLDPANLPAGTRSGARAVPERHLVGRDDRVVPPALLHRYARGRPDVLVIEWPGFDHVCCWIEAWPRVLAGLDP